jgi:hypothetical protein
MTKKIVIGAALAAGATMIYWALAQPAPKPLGSIFPTGAALYVEAKDFGSLVSDWDRSAEKDSWLKSSNYAAFSRSTLFLKLSSAQQDFEAAAGVPPDYALLKSVAGTNSALAIYNIGALRFLYVTHLPSARATSTLLWSGRAKYQTRKAGGVDFFVKTNTGTNRTAAFAYAGDLLLLATDEDLMAGALELIASNASASRPSLASEKWFADATNAAQGNPGELRLVHNVDRLEQAPQFRSNWVQRNARDLREFSSGLADLDRSSGAFNERRVLLRANSSAAITDESATGQLLAAVPDDAGFYRVRLHPADQDAEQAMEEKIFASTAPPKRRDDFAPGVENTVESGSEQDLEMRIDEPPLTDDRVGRAFAPLHAQLKLGRLGAMAEISSSRVAADQVFVATQSAVVLLASSNWDANAVRGAVSSAAGSLWSNGPSNGGAGVGWRAAANGVSELDGLGRVAIAIEGRWLVIGNSRDLVAAIFARRNRAAIAGAVYAAEWRHARELPNFERMMKLIDFPQAGASAPGREPMFYSENLASFGRVLRRVQSAAIAVHDQGSMLRETVVYRVTP